MATPQYTASPLGLITSFSEFNYGTSSGIGGVQSIFTSYQSPKHKMILKTNNGKFNSVLSGSPHSDEVYDMTTSNIISKLKDIDQLKLNFADFAYLKDFGVYPNNRLIVARRFPQPVVDDLYSIPTSVGEPLSTVIGYNKEEDDFIKLTFNEEWEDAEISFKNLLNDVGGDFGMKGQFQLGNILESGLNILPLPGATLLLQRKIMKSLGIISSEDEAIIPQGDPNLIKQAKVRSLIGEDAGGSGLSCKVSITLKTVYEQKFINGVDPTIVFMDILNNALNMGTSPATFYLGKQNDARNNVSTAIKKFMDNPFEFIKDFIKSIIDAFSGQLTTLNKGMTSPSKDTSTENPAGQGANQILKLLNDDSGEPRKDDKGNIIKGISRYVKDFIKNKYKVKFLGIVSALTGAPSTPWHVTIGNPLRPIFCSGDMLCTGVDVNFGPQLSFNDLPTYIEVEVKLTSARNLGLQEIFSKFNSGGIRLLTGTSSSVGEYLAGIAQSFWNSEQNYGTFSNTSTVPAKSSQSPQSTDGAQKKDNSLSATSSNLTKVNIPTTPIINSNIPTITPSLTSDTEASSDPYAESPSVPAGSNSTADSLRRQGSQDSTGSTDGFSDQLISPDDKPYNGTSATPIDKTGASSTTPDTWNIGKPVSTGSLSYSNGVTYDYTVTKGLSHGIFESYVTGSDGTSYTFQGKSKKSAINNMQSELFKINNPNT